MIEARRPGGGEVDIGPIALGRGGSGAVAVGVSPIGIVCEGGEDYGVANCALEEEGAVEIEGAYHLHNLPSR